MRALGGSASMSDTKNHKEAQIYLCDSPLPKGGTQQMDVVTWLNSNKTDHYFLYDQNENY